ncbi:MAG TPA: hypothetical protein VHC70_01665 [Phycisphaerales bacterium]|nr:hypothetical protein [Phycisphaerales bacterium]
MTALPNPSSGSPSPGLPAPPAPPARPGPPLRPGGTARFLVATLIVFLLLGGIVVGLAYWMKATEGHEYGPDKLTFPDNRYYGQK